MDKVIGSYTEWQPLETALVGRINHDVKVNMSDRVQYDKKEYTKIFDETDRYLDDLSDLVKSFGVHVERPKPTSVLNYSYCIKDIEFRSDEDANRKFISSFDVDFTKHPIGVRDLITCIDNKIIEFNSIDNIRHFESTAYYSNLLKI